MKKIIGTLCVSIFFAAQISAQITGNFSIFPFLQTTQVSAKKDNQYFVVDFIVTNESQTDSLAIASGELIPEPVEPTKTGATFVGWYTEKTGGEKWDFKTLVMPEKKLVLYARFKEVNGTILLSSNRTKIMTKTMEDTSSFDVVSIFGVKAVDTVDGNLIEKEMFTIEGLEKLDLTTTGTYELTFSVTNSVGNKESLLLIVEVQESLITGIIFEDTINFNSKNDEEMYFNDVLVSLIDTDTNMPVAQTRTAMDGSYQLGIPDGVTAFKLKVDTPKGYIQAPKAFDSVFNDFGESDIFTTHGNDFKQVNIGFAKAVRVSVSSTGVDFKIHEQKKVDITISNGTLFETKIADTSLFSFEQTPSGLVLTNLAQGETDVQISYKDGYGRPAAPQSVIVIKAE